MASISRVCCVCADIRRMNEQALYAVNTGMIILGGGLMKHHICNANLMVSEEGGTFLKHISKGQPRKIQLHLILAISSSLDGSYGDHQVLWRQFHGYFTLYCSTHITKFI